MYVCMYVCMYVYMYVCMYACMYVSMYVHVIQNLNRARLGFGFRVHGFKGIGSRVWTGFYMRGYEVTQTLKCSTCFGLTSFLIIGS